MDEKFTVDTDEDVVLTLMSCLFSTELKALYKKESLQIGPTLCGRLGREDSITLKPPRTS